MKAVILSAGQGKRLLPLTADNPKCMLNIEDRTLIEWQINELAKCGIKRVSVVVGYHAARVEQLLQRCYGVQRVKTIYNPTFAWADNLFSCWVALREMAEDFVLLNGDTLFEAGVMKGLLATPVQPVTLVIHKKRSYDADDMKVTLDGTRLVSIGKNLANEKIDGESIGMILFRGDGPSLFRSAVENAMCDPRAREKWYLSVIDQMARSMPIWTCSTNEFEWCEVDFPVDLKHAHKVVRACAVNDAKITGLNSAFPQREWALG